MVQSKTRVVVAEVGSIICVAFIDCSVFVCECEGWRCAGKAPIAPAGKQEQVM